MATRTLLGIPVGPEIYTQHLLSRFLFPGSCELKIDASVFSAVVNGEDSGGNMPISKSVSVTYRYETLGISPHWRFFIASRNVN